MNKSTFSVLILLIAIASADDDVQYTYDNDVMVLDEGNFHQAVSKFEYLFLEFYAPWCGHCQKLAPEYEKAAKALKEEGIVLAKVDASVHRKLAEAQGVNGYPTLKFVTQGKEVKFEGGRTADGIQQWIWSHINPGSEQLNTTSQIEAAIQDSDTLFFYFADETPKDGKDREFRRYKEFSYTIKATKFAHTHLPEARGQYNIPRNVNFVVFKKGDQKLATYTSGKLKIPEMKAFVDLNSRPRVVDLDENWEWLQEKVFTKDKPVLVHFTNGDASIQDSVRQASFVTLIDHYQDHPSEDYLIFLQVEKSDANREKLLDRLQVKDEDATGIYLAAKNGTLKFRLAKPITKDSLLGFISDWKDGKAPRYFRQQEVPVESTGPVKLLVGSTYASLVQNSYQDVVVLYFDSRNEEHAVVQRQYENIALRLSKNDLVFTKIDISQNEVNDMQDPIDITKIRLYRGENPRDYVKFVLRANKLQEERLVKWVRENSKLEVQDPKGDL